MKRVPWWVLALELGVGRPDRPGAHPAGLVDVNSAPESALRALPGVDRALARRIERLREHTVFLPR